MDQQFGVARFSVTLSPGYTKPNILAYFMAVLFTICFFVFIDSSQAFLIKDGLGIPSNQLGHATATISTVSEGVIILTCALWGIQSDVSGRHLTFGIGFVCMAIGFILYPVAKTLEELLVYRVIFALGASACSTMLTAVLGDVVVESDRGKIAGMAGLLSGAGALIGLFVLLPLPVRIGVKNTFYIVGALSGLVAIFCFLYINNRRVWNNTDGGYEPTASDSQDLAKKPFNFKVYISNAIAAGKEGLLVKDRQVYLGYFTSFVARMDATAITLFIPLWVYQYYLSTNQCTGDLNSPEIKDLCRVAYTRASVLSGIAQTFALISAPFFGYFLDKVYRPKVVLIAALIAGSGYLLLGISGDPSAAINFAYVILVGCGEIGLVIASISLVTHENVPLGSRGNIAGISGFFGAVGILFISLVGGKTFDSWFNGAPFVLLAITNGALFISAALAILYPNNATTAAENP